MEFAHLFMYLFIYLLSSGAASYVLGLFFYSGTIWGTAEGSFTDDVTGDLEDVVAET